MNSVTLVLKLKEAALSGLTACDASACHFFISFTSCLETYCDGAGICSQGRMWPQSILISVPPFATQTLYLHHRAFLNSHRHFNSLRVKVPKKNSGKSSWLETYIFDSKQLPWNHSEQSDLSNNHHIAACDWQVQKEPWLLLVTDMNPKCS